MYVKSCSNFRREKFDLKKAEKFLKYEDLTLEIQCMLNVKTNGMPVTIGATRTISKSFRK
jgi:hypothetical protein